MKIEIERKLPTLYFKDIYPGVAFRKTESMNNSFYIKLSNREVEGGNAVWFPPDGSPPRGTNTRPYEPIVALRIDSIKLSEILTNNES